MNAFQNGDWSLLKEATRDVLHQPQRAEKLHKHFDACVRGAIEAGADGAFLSGAGSCVHFQNLKVYQT